MGEITVLRQDLSGLEAASSSMRETATWSASMGSPDQIINGVKAIIDARSNDTAQNDSWAQSAITTHRDTIVGSRFALNAKPDVLLLGVDPKSSWASDFQQTAEALWNSVAESRECWIDAARRRTMTEMCRQALSSWATTGEVLAPAEFIREADRPCRTAIHLISPSRLSNSMNGMDLAYSSERGYKRSRGIRMNYYNRHLAYEIRRAHPGDYADRYSMQWDVVPAALPWGRKQMIYLSEPLLVEQTRGLGDMAAALPHMRMSKKHSQIALQKAVLGATYAAVIESDLPPAELAVAMGALTQGGGLSGNGTPTDQLIDGWESIVGSCLGMIQAFMSGSNNIKLDGAQIPALPIGSKLKMLNADNGGGASYETFEASLNRKTARNLGMSYEEFTGDYSRTNYSSGKMSSAKADRFMNARKKFACDYLAGDAYALWLEEEISNPLTPLPLPPTWDGDRLNFYQPHQKAALTRCDWIGQGSGQIDEMKETQAAMLRVKGGFSTWERECAKLGIDWREMAAQQGRERKLFQELDLVFSGDATQDSSEVDGQVQLADNPGADT